MTGTERLEDRVDIASAVDSAPIGRFVISIVVLCAAVALLDGYDTLAISYVAPVIAAAWKLPKEAFGPIFSGHYIGAAIGAAAFGMLADRYGRRPIIIASTATFGIFALLTPLTYDFVSLLAVRLLTGIGLGGALSTVIAMVAEYSPARHRATLVSVMYAAFPFGGVIGGPLSAYVIPNFGWQQVFLIGGIAPVILLLLLAFALPESVRFLQVQGTDSKRVAAIMQRMLPGNQVQYTALAPSPSKSAAGSSLRELLSRDYARLTILLSFASFITQLIIVYVITWMPTLLTSAGLPLGRAILASATFSLGGIIGSLLLARLIDRQNSYRALIAAYLASALAVGAIGFSTFNPGFLIAAVGLAGVTIVGAQVNLSAYAAAVYPTSIRSTGIGWVVGIGRLGAIAGALLGTALVAAGLELEAQYLIAAIPALFAGLAVALTRTPQQVQAGITARAAQPAR